MEHKKKDKKGIQPFDAQRLFYSCRLNETLDILRKLVGMNHSINDESIHKDKELRLRHNLSLVEYLKNRKPTVNSTLQCGALIDFQNELTKLLTIITKQQEIGSSNITLNNHLTINSTDIMTMNLPLSFLENQEVVYILYNLSACLFQSNRFGSAISILENLIKNIDLIEDKLSIHICFFYLDILIHSGQGNYNLSSNIEKEAYSKKFQNVIDILKKLYPSSSNQPNNNVNDDDISYLGNILEISIEFRFRLHLYKGKLALFQENIKSAKKELKHALEIYQKEIKTHNHNYSYNNHVDIRKSILDYGIQPDLNVQNATALFLKANLEYIKENYQKSIRLIASCQRDAVHESIFFNNLGCIHYQMKKKKAAKIYFARAIREIITNNKHNNVKKNQQNTKDGNSGQVSLITGPVDCEIYYNNGLINLINKKYEVAFNCFYYCCRLFYKRPLVWLRMGECCIKAEDEKMNNNGKYKNSLLRGVIGSAMNRRVLLPTSNPDTPPVRTNFNSIPKISLDYGIKCFLNVIALTEKFKEIDGKTTEKDDSIFKNNNDGLLQAAMVNLSYAYLCINEPLMTINMAKKLLSIKTCRSANRYVAQTYLAEGLAMLSQATEATNCLKIKEMTTSCDDYAKKMNEKSTDIRASLHVNIATGLILQDKMEQAQENVTEALNYDIHSIDARRLLIFINLKKNYTRNALKYLKLGTLTK